MKDMDYSDIEGFLSDIDGLLTKEGEFDEKTVEQLADEAPEVLNRVIVLILYTQGRQIQNAMEALMSIDEQLFGPDIMENLDVLPFSKVQELRGRLSEMAYSYMQFSEAFTRQNEEFLEYQLTDGEEELLRTIKSLSTEKIEQLIATGTSLEQQEDWDDSDGEEPE